MGRTSQTLPAAAKVRKHGHMFQRGSECCLKRDGEQSLLVYQEPTDSKRLSRVKLEKVSEDAIGPRGKDQLTVSTWTQEEMGKVNICQIFVS